MKIAVLATLSPSTPKLSPSTPKLFVSLAISQPGHFGNKLELWRRFCIEPFVNVYLRVVWTDLLDLGFYFWIKMLDAVNMFFLIPQSCESFSRGQMVLFFVCSVLLCLFNDVWSRFSNVGHIRRIKETIDSLDAESSPVSIMLPGIPVNLT